jgi:hypothetical protein
LVNAVHVKNAGPKTDKADARWLAKLMRWAAPLSFIPPRRATSGTLTVSTVVQEREVNRIHGKLERAHRWPRRTVDTRASLDGRY